MWEHYRPHQFGAMLQLLAFAVLRIWKHGTPSSHRTLHLISLGVTLLPIKSIVFMSFSFWISCQSPFGPYKFLPWQRLAHSVRNPRVRWHGNSLVAFQFSPPIACTENGNTSMPTWSEQMKLPMAGDALLGWWYRNQWLLSTPVTIFGCAMAYA